LLWVLHTGEMPNQRKKSKVHLGGYYERQLKDELVRLARQRKISISLLVEEMLRAGVEDYQRRKRSAGESQWPPQ